MVTNKIITFPKQSLQCYFPHREILYTGMRTFVSTKMVPKFSLCFKKVHYTFNSVNLQYELDSTVLPLYSLVNDQRMIHSPYINDTIG